MIKKRKFPNFSAAIIILFIFMSGCGSNPSSLDELKATYIDEPILLESSEFVFATSNWEDEYVFDLRSIELVQKGSFNDLELSYWTGSSCDEDVWVHNYRKGRWDQIGFSPGPDIMCLCVMTEQCHLFSARGLKPKEYLSIDLKMKIRGTFWPPAKIRALKINPNYFAVPILLEGLYSFDGLSYDGESLWISSNLSDRIYNLSLTGKVKGEFEAPSGYPFGLAYDGYSLWLASGTNQIFKLTSWGEVLCQFSVPTDYPGGLAWGGGILWLAEYERMFGLSQIFGIDSYASCSVYSAVLTDSWEFADEGTQGLAWDGNHLLVVAGHLSDGIFTLYKLTTAGEVVESFDLPVKFPRELAWDDEAVWVLCQGPKELRSGDPVIARFKLN